MNRLYRIGAAALACAMLTASLSACSTPTANNTDPAKQLMATKEDGSLDLSVVTDPFAATAGVFADTVVATAGDLEITAGQLLYHSARAADSYVQYNYYYSGSSELPWDTAGEDGVTFEETLKGDSLKTALLYTILPVIGKQEGLTPNQEEIDSMLSAIDELKVSLNDNDTALTYALWQEPLTAALYEEMATAGVMYTQLQDLYYGENGVRDVSDAEVLRYFEDEQGYYKVKHLLIKTVDTTVSPTIGDDGNYVYASLDEATVAGKTALANDIVAQLAASDDPIALFETLRAEYSEDVAADGSLNDVDGYIAYPGQMVPEFEAASLALNAGEFSGIVESVYGYHIILRMELEPTAEFRSQYISTKMQDEQQSWLDANEIVTNEAFDAIDLSDFYTNLSTLRDALNVELTAITAPEDASVPDSSSAADASGSASSASSSSSAG